jgi:hypothetical protein
VTAACWGVSFSKSSRTKVFSVDKSKIYILQKFFNLDKLEPSPVMQAVQKKIELSKRVLSGEWIAAFLGEAVL